MGSKEKKKASTKPAPKQPEAARKNLFWMLIVLLVSTWTFVLGVLMGRGMAPVDIDVNALQKELAEIKAAVIRKQQELIAAEDPDEEITQLEFHEALKDNRLRTEIPKDIQKTMKNPAADAPPAVKTSGKKQISQKAPDKKETPAPKAPAAVGKPAAEVADGNYVIQVASLANAKDADKMIADLRQKGFAAFRTHVEVSGKTYYRVRVGGFSDRSGAQSAMAALNELGTKPYLIKN